MSKLPLNQIIAKYEQNTQKLASISDTQELIKLSRLQKHLDVQHLLATKIQKLENSIKENQDLLNETEDEELKELSLQDNLQMQQELDQAEQELLGYLAPTDPKDENNIFLEIRAAAGGDESSLFASEMLRMYNYFCQQMDLKLKVVYSSENSLGGLKEVICEVRGDNSYAWFKYEAGVHRVQRVPSTEKQGRVHTSTVSVVVMPLLENSSDFKLEAKDIEIIASTSQGAGGQSVNTTYSAIRVKHLPTGLEAQSQDERNQQQNKIKAIQVLTSRVYDFFEQQRLDAESKERKGQVGKADRSEKIRTYNFPQDRLTDHRYNHSWSQLPEIMNGKLVEVIQEVKRLEAKEILNQLSSDEIA